MIFTYFAEGKSLMDVTIGMMIPMKVKGSPPVRLSIGSKCGTVKHTIKQNTIIAVRIPTRFNVNSKIKEQ